MNRHIKFLVGTIIVVFLIALTSCDMFGLKYPFDKGNDNQTENNGETENDNQDNLVDDSIKVNVALGYPDEISSKDISNKEHYLIERDSYVLSYNNETLIPNWVSWHLCKKDIGGFGRTDFEPDPDLPNGFKVVEHADYTGSGLDRGHMCPSKSRSGSASRRDQTYYMTNMVPQNHKNNSGAWQKLEAELQGICANTGREAYIVSGPYGRGGETSDNGSGVTPGIRKDYIVKNGKRITVPAVTWKVAIVFPEGNNDIERIKDMNPEQILVYAVWMPNTEAVKARYQDHMVSIDYVESMTGLDFFAEIDDTLENLLESRFSERDPIAQPAFDVAV